MLADVARWNDAQHAKVISWVHLAFGATVAAVLTWRALSHRQVICGAASAWLLLCLPLRLPSWLVVPGLYCAVRGGTRSSRLLGVALGALVYGALCSHQFWAVGGTVHQPVAISIPIEPSTVLRMAMDMAYTSPWITSLIGPVLRPASAWMSDACGQHWNRTLQVNERHPVLIQFVKRYNVDMTTYSPAD
jgi:hypothetical protein